jgi:hypothetical protein
MFSFLRDLLDALINKDQPNWERYVRAEAVILTAEAGLLDQRVFITIKAN